MTARSPRRSDAPTRIRNAYGRFSVIPEQLIRDKTVSDGALRLYALLWDYSSADSEERDVWPRRSELAADLQVSLDTIDRRVAELEQRGAIAVDADFDGDNRRNVYTILQLGVIHKGRKSAAHSEEPIGRKSAAQKGRKSAASLKEPEPLNQRDSPVPEITTDRETPAVDRTGPKPHPASTTVGQPLHCPDVFAAVGHMLPDTFDDAQLEQLADEIITHADTRVLDRTGYVIMTLRNSVKWDQKSAGRWIRRALDIAEEAAGIRAHGRAAGF